MAGKHLYGFARLPMLVRCLKLSSLIIVHDLHHHPV